MTHLFELFVALIKILNQLTYFPIIKIPLINTGTSNLFLSLKRTTSAFCNMPSDLSRKRLSQQTTGLHGGMILN